MPSAGLQVAVLGIDGIEKQPLVDELAARFRRVGREVRPLSWQSFLDAVPEGDEPGFPADALERLWLTAFRLFFGGARVEGEELRLPDAYRAVVREGVVERLGSSAVSGLRGTGPLTTGLVELAGFTILHHEVVRPLVARGYVVLQSSVGLKNLVKSLAMAEDADASVAEAAAALLPFVRELFGRHLAADAGIYVAGRPEAALEALRARGRAPGVFESFGAGGGDPVETFLALQERCVGEFEAFAAEYGWIRVEAEDVLDAAKRSRVADRIFEELSGARPRAPL